MDETGFFKKFISWLRNNTGGFLLLNLDIWLCVFTAEKQGARISIVISRTDPGGLSRQLLFIPSWEASLPAHTSHSLWEQCRRWHTWLQQETGTLRSPCRQTHPPPTQPLQPSNKQGKKSRKPTHATPLQGVTVPTCSYTLLQPGG